MTADAGDDLDACAGLTAEPTSGARELLRAPLCVGPYRPFVAEIVAVATTGGGIMQLVGARRKSFHILNVLVQANRLEPLAGAGALADS